MTRNIKNVLVIIAMFTGMIISGAVCWNNFVGYLKADCLASVADDFAAIKGMPEFIDMFVGKPEDYLITLLLSAAVATACLIGVGYFTDKTITCWRRNQENEDAE